MVPLGRLGVGVGVGGQGLLHYTDPILTKQIVSVCVCISMDIRIIMLVCESSCPATHICIYIYTVQVQLYSQSTVMEVGMPGDDHLLGENPCFKTPL